MIDSDVFYNEEAEKALLGILIRDGRGHDLSKIRTGWFYKSNHKNIFAEIRKAEKEGLEYNLLVLAERLTSKGISTSYITDIIQQAGVSTSTYIQIIKNKYNVRKMLKLADDITNHAVKGMDVKEYMDRIAKKVYDMALDVCATKEHDTMRDLVLTVVEEIEHAKLHGVSVAIPTGYPTLDAVIGGFERSYLYVLAARPSMGKTALMLNIADYIARNTDKVIALFSLETSSKDFAYRLISAQSEVPVNILKRGEYDESFHKDVLAAAGILNKNRINIVNAAGMTFDQIAAKCAEMKSTFGLDIMFLDYLQLIRGKGTDEYATYTEASKGMKELAMQLDIPVVMLSQLNRGVEMRDNKRPRMSDLRATGQIEQDADCIMFIYRDDYYNPNSDVKGQAEVIISKQRNGPLGVANLRYIDYITKFKEL